MGTSGAEASAGSAVRSAFSSALPHPRSWAPGPLERRLGDAERRAGTPTRRDSHGLLLNPTRLLLAPWRQCLREGHSRRLQQERYCWGGIHPKILALPAAQGVTIHLVRGYRGIGQEADGGRTGDLVTPESRVNTGVREVVHRRELMRRLLGGPRAGLPTVPSSGSEKGCLACFLSEMKSRAWWTGE